MPGRLTISVVVPTLNEAVVVAPTLTTARAADVEIIVVDGGSRDATVAVARALADRVLETARGRARQMNAGAAVARGDVLLFLHADTRLPAGYAQAVARALADPRVVGGRFDVRLDATGLAYRVVGRLISVRSRVTRVATGDQAIFVRRAVFGCLGGYPAVYILSWRRYSAVLPKLPDLVRRVRRLEQALKKGNEAEENEE